MAPAPLPPRQHSTDLVYYLTPATRPPASYGFAVAGLALTQNITPVWVRTDEDGHLLPLVVPPVPVPAQDPKPWSPAPHYEPGE